MKMNEREKKRLLKSICQTLEGCQTSIKSHPKVITDLKKLYYKQTSSQDAAGRYQKCFVTLIWQAMLVPFKEVKCPAQERMCAVFTEFVKSVGTGEDVELFKFPIRNLRPFFYRVLQIFKAQHADSRHLVRLRQTELVHEILKIHRLDDDYVDLKKDLLSVLSERIRDKQSTVRSVAFKCLQYFLGEITPELFQQTKYHAEYDPNCEARKSAFAVVCAVPLIKSSFIINKAYDREESIRVEAFKALLRVPVTRLKSDQRISVLQWGLMQPSCITMVKKIVLEELLPAWINSEPSTPNGCKHGVINFLTLLDVSTSPRTAELVLKSMYPNDSEETFSKVDLSFLEEDKLISITETKLETIVYWRFLSRRFHKRPFCRDKIIPGPGELTQFIYKLVEIIHEEHFLAAEQNRAEGFENILCLAQILHIAELCEYEEGSRHTTESMLRHILRDHVLDEAVVIHTAVDVAHSVLGEDDFNTFMLEIIQEIFEPQEEFQTPVVVNKKKSNEKSLSVHVAQRQSINLSARNSGISTNSTITDDSTLETSQSHNNSSSRQIVARISTRLTEEEIQKFKNERGELMLKRHRLCDQKDKAIRSNDFLAAHNINLEVVSIKTREEEIQKKLQDNEKSLQYPSFLQPEVLRSDQDNFPSLLLSPIESNTTPTDDDTIPDQGQVGSAKTVIPFANRLRGIVMFTRFLTWQQQLSPFSRMMYEQHVCPSLEEEDYRVRLHAIYIIGMVGLLDASKAKTALAVMINAVAPHEDNRVRAAAFKVIIDLFLQHDFPVFRITEDDEEAAHLLPHPMDKFDSEISTAEMEKYLLDLLNSFPGGREEDQQNVQHICLQFMGMMKLLIRKRITDSNVISQLLIIWADPGFTGTPLCFNIGYWLPLYASMGVPEALRVGTAFLKCVKNHKSLTRTDSEDETEAELNLDKLAGFVFPSINARALAKFEGGSTVHAQVALQILTEVSRDLDCPNNLTFVKFLKMLEIYDEPYITRIRRKVKNILQQLSYLPKKGLKHVLINFEKQLTKRFGPLKSSGNEDISETEKEEEEDAFSDESKSGDDMANGEKRTMVESLQKEIRNDLDENNDDEGWDN